MIAIPHEIPPEEYLSIEANSPHRHEYRRGLVYAMAGGTDNHNRLGLNLINLIDRHLGDSDCRYYAGDVKVNYKNEFFYYPDVFVTCDRRDQKDRLIKRYPKLIAEVLSPATQNFDRDEKFNDYRQIETLQEYVLISQDEQSVEVRRCREDRTWETVVYGVGERVILKSIELEFEIARLYRGLD